MRQRLLIIILILVIGGFVVIKYMDSKNHITSTPSEIDTIIQAVQTGATKTGETTIDVTATSSGQPQYVGGGDYADYTEGGLIGANQAHKRIILIVEESSDPTSEALHDDIVARAERIPANTIIFFMNIKTDSDIVHKMRVTYPNTIIYINEKGQEIRRKGNGIVSLSQVVSGIDGLK